MVGRWKHLPIMVNELKHTIDELSTQDLSIIALAMDYFLCNYEHTNMDVVDLENLFMHIDLLAEEAEESTSTRLVERQDNLLVVDFSAKD